MPKPHVMLFMLALFAPFVACSREQAVTFKGPTSNERIDLNKYDLSSEITDPSGKLLTAVTVKKGRIDFSRPAGQSRGELLQSLKAMGVQRIYSPLLRELKISSQGQLGIALPTGTSGSDLSGETASMQALKEMDDGFDLSLGEGATILDAKSSVVATITNANGTPSLAFASGQSLKTLYDAGVRSFFYKFDVVGGQLKMHEVKIIKGADGEFSLL